MGKFTAKKECVFHLKHNEWGVDTKLSGSIVKLRMSESTVGLLIDKSGMDSVCSNADDRILICKGCTQFAENKLRFPELAVQTEDVFVFSSESNLLKQPRFNDFLNLAGITIQKMIAEEPCDYEMKDLKKLLDFDIEKYLTTINKSLIYFLHGVKGNRIRIDEHLAKHQELKTKHTYKLLKTVESVLNLTGLKFIFPVHLRESILVHSVGGGCLGMKIMSSSTPYSNYDQIKSWLETLGTEAHLNFDGDIMAVFDNNQSMTRRWRISLDNKVFCHVITTVAFFQINSNGELQYSYEKRPGNWILAEISPSEWKKIKFIDQRMDVKQTHFVYLSKHWDKMLQQVKDEQIEVMAHENGASKYKDRVDEYVYDKQKEKNYKKCYKCNRDNIEKRKIVCPNPDCKENLKKSKNEHFGLNDKSTYVEKPKKSYNKHDTAKTYEIKLCEDKGSTKAYLYEQNFQHGLSTPVNKCSVSNPVFQNPCSYDACVSVLRHIGFKAGILCYVTMNNRFPNTTKSHRHWVTVTCDGSPYNLCFRIIMSTYKCDLCGHTTIGVTAMKKHLTEYHYIHENDVKYHFILEFGWVLLQPGLGK